jgi:hypothetical protein
VFILLRCFLLIFFSQSFKELSCDYSSFQTQIIYQPSVSILTSFPSTRSFREGKDNWLFFIDKLF